MEVLLAAKKQGIEDEMEEFMEKIDKKLEAKKKELNQMAEEVETDWRKLQERKNEVEDILVCWENFLNEAIARKEEDLCCPICLEASKTPIFSCPDSHIICGSCLPNLQSQECPQCRVELPEAPRRNRMWCVARLDIVGCNPQDYTNHNNS